MKKTFHTHSPEETEALGERIGKSLKGGELIAYKGGLGAGKTAMTRGIARGLGITAPVSSPTFTIVNEYPGEITLYHFDMYRVGSWEDLESTGFFDYFDSRSVICVEWWENVEEMLTGYSPIVIELSGEGGERQITIGM
ncbi:MAG: tRNA (adenosine(37)-N6)-threonylcarbamoyltransferase complex ATPase subunit type 1 TsaE [Ruminococcus sp.]|nr:tRNA (adenosine(37)-N6)-threonylcarbamoyltransferase complex ATPase subunit type 1 TsaE [Ruminococcus sp.]